MDRIEFMRRTDSRHLQTQIKFKIKEVFRERDEELDRRRNRLQMMLSMEELQQEEEMANLFRARILENMQKRLDWIATAKFEKEEAEREFLKLKQIQRELVNCEEMRPKESKEITEETKQAQLIQIAEKRAHLMKEKEIDKIWFEASMCLEKEKEKQLQYENRLRKIIANRAVEVLDGQLEYLKCVKELENEEKKEENIKNVRAINEDFLREDLKKRRQCEQKIKELTRQKHELTTLEAEKLHQTKQVQFIEDKTNEMQNIQLKQEKDLLKIKQENEKELSKIYLQYAKDKKSEMNCRNKMLDTALVAYGRQMSTQPTKKVPYQKSVR